MAVYKTENIIVGAAAAYISVADSTMSAASWTLTPTGGKAKPDLAASLDPGTGDAGPLMDADTANWRSLGFTTGGIETTYAPEYTDIEVDQLLDAALIFKSKMTVTVKTTLSEATLENLLVAWGQSASTLTGTAGAFQDLGISSGALGDYPVERSMVFVGPGPRTAAGVRLQRLYHLRRCLQVDSTAIGQMRTEATTIPVSFRCLPNPAFSYKEYGRVQNRVLS